MTVDRDVFAASATSVSEDDCVAGTWSIATRSEGQTSVPIASSIRSPGWTSDRYAQEPSAIRTRCFSAPSMV
jgi:hypothetical protein